MIVYFTFYPREGFLAIVKVSVKIQDLKAHFCEILKLRYLRCNKKSCQLLLRSDRNFYKCQKGGWYIDLVKMN